MVGKNQSYVRQINRRTIVQTLQKENCSATILAQKLGLSNAALSAILGELTKDGYIKKVESDGKCGCGRPPIYYSFNDNWGCLLAIVLADYYATIAISDMRMNILDSETVRVSKYDLSMICDLVLKAKEMLSSDRFAGIDLVSVDFAVPGKVNGKTGELQLSPQFDESIFREGNSIVNLFNKQFGVPVTISNDINLAGIGEMTCGLLKGLENGLLVHVDEGVGGALVLGGNLYCGDQGFSGEIGLMRSNFRGKNDALDEFISLRVIKDYVSELKGTQMHTSDIVRLYREDAEVRSYINETAHCLGIKLRDIVELLDISTIVLSGRVVQFGEEYLQILNDEVSQSINGAKVSASVLGKEATVYGLLSQAIRKSTEAI